MNSHLLVSGGLHVVKCLGPVRIRRALPVRLAPLREPSSRPCRIHILGKVGERRQRNFRTPFSQYKCQEEIIEILVIRGLTFRTAAQPACFIPHPVIWQAFPQRVGKGRPLAPGRTGVQKNRILKGPFLASVWSGVVSSGGPRLTLLSKTRRQQVMLSTGGGGCVSVSITAVLVSPLAGRWTGHQMNGVSDSPNHNELVLFSPLDR